MSTDPTPLLERALAARTALREADDLSAFRVFNGFVEGCPELALDLYGHTLVIHDHGASAEQLRAVEDFGRARLSIRALLVKRRGSVSEDERRGTLRFGTMADLDRRALENGVAYALDLTLNQDASLYLDTRSVRTWARANLAGAQVLNTFAYTGSLGVAARAAPAARVVQTDLSRSFLNLAKVSYGLNGWPIARADFRTGDFFDVMGELKRQGALFDAVFVDPPFFSSTDKGTVNLETEAARILNKVRPLIGDGGRLVAINNALFVPGASYLAQLQALCADGYLEIEQFLPVDEDFTGFPETRAGQPPADPAPFNHSTKIAVLRVKRKDGRRANASG